MQDPNTSLIPPPPPLQYFTAARVHPFKCHAKGFKVHFYSKKFEVSCQFIINMCWRSGAITPTSRRLYAIMPRGVQLGDLRTFVHGLHLITAAFHQ